MQTKNVTINNFVWRVAAPTMTTTASTKMAQEKNNNQLCMNTTKVVITSTCGSGDDETMMKPMGDAVNLSTNNTTHDNQ